MQKVIVWSEVKGYMWAELENGRIYDQLGLREDLETRQNTSLIQLQLDNDKGEQQLETAEEALEDIVRIVQERVGQALADINYWGSND